MSLSTSWEQCEFQTSQKANFVFPSTSKERPIDKGSLHGKIVEAMPPLVGLWRHLQRWPGEYYGVIMRSVACYLSMCLSQTSMAHGNSDQTSKLFLMWEFEQHSQALGAVIETSGSLWGREADPIRESSHSRLSYTAASFSSLLRGAGIVLLSKRDTLLALPSRDSGTLSATAVPPSALLR